METHNTCKSAPQVECSTIGAGNGTKKKMKETEKGFQQVWNGFTNAVLQKFPSHPECDDPVLLVKNSGLFNLSESQLNTVLLLGIVHELVERSLGVEEAMSVAITAEQIDTLRHIVDSIRNQLSL